MRTVDFDEVLVFPVAREKWLTVATQTLLDLARRGFRLLPDRVGQEVLLFDDTTGEMEVRAEVWCDDGNSFVVGMYLDGDDWVWKPKDPSVN